MRGSIYEHNRQPIWSKKCHGSDICSQPQEYMQGVWGNFKESEGWSICHHNCLCLRITCNDCCGSGILDHNGEKSRCKELSMRAYLIKSSSAARECHGSGICCHNCRKSTCKDCAEGLICQYNWVNSQCKEFHGSGICHHNSEKSSRRNAKH